MRGDDAKTWELRGRGVEVRYWKKLEDVKGCTSVDGPAAGDGGAAQAAEDAFVLKHAKEPGKHDGAITVTDTGGCSRRVAVSSRKGLRRRVGWVVGQDGLAYQLVSAAWIVPLLLLLAALAGCCIQLAVRPDTSPLVTGGVVPSETVQVTTPAQTGQIKIPGYSDFEASSATKVALSNPEENSAYLFKYTCSVGGKVVHTTPYWIEPGKADLWRAGADLAGYADQTVKVTIKVSTCRADTQQACNGSEQTVTVEVR